MYLNQLQASLFYPHLYSSAVNPAAASLHLHNNGQHTQQHHLVAGSGNSDHHHQAQPALDEYGNDMNNPAAAGAGARDDYLDPGDPEGQTGPIRGAYGSGRSEHGVWRPY